MNITISGNISSEDDISISLRHSGRGFYQDLSKYLVYELSEIDEMDGKEGNLWEMEMTLPYPYSETSGDLTLRVKDKHSGDTTNTRLIVRQEEQEVAPFFDPVPKSFKTYPGQDVFINTKAKGSTPINVSIYSSKVFMF